MLTAAVVAGAAFIGTGGGLAMAEQAPQAPVVDVAVDRRSRTPEAPPVREDLVARVRAEIARGRYVTDDKLRIAVERLLETERSRRAG